LAHVDEWLMLLAQGRGIVRCKSLLLGVKCSATVFALCCTTRRITRKHRQPALARKISIIKKVFNHD
jgi:hypothetical protein